MSVNWQHKIQQHEIQPPADAWEKISNALDVEFEPGDIMLSQKLQDFEITPPGNILEKILESIGPEQPTTTERKVLYIPFKRIAVAAVGIGLVILSVIYFLSPKSPSVPATTAGVLPSIPDRKQSPVDQVQPGNSSTSAQDLPSQAVSIVQDRTRRESINSKKAGATNDVKHVNPVLASNEATPISVSAPPIYDGNGNIIMDESLVSAPDENYIIVTSPNGEQTKISRKFLKMLTVMNGGTDNHYVHPENFLWKLRFEEWRSKLLQQASYMPTANNFLDIMELKEILQNN